MLTRSSRAQRRFDAHRLAYVSVELRQFGPALDYVGALQALPSVTNQQRYRRAPGEPCLCRFQLLMHALPAQFDFAPHSHVATLYQAYALLELGRGAEASDGLVRAVQALDLRESSAVAHATALRLNLVALHASSTTLDRAEALLLPCIRAAAGTDLDGVALLRSGRWQPAGPYGAAVVLLGVHLLLSRDLAAAASQLLTTNRALPGLFHETTAAPKA